MAITLRNTKGQELSHNELDTNFAELYNSSSVDNHVVTLFSHGTGSFTALTHSLSINTGSTFTLYSESGSLGTVAGNLTVTGTVTAQEFNTEITSASIIYTSGSTKFGDTQDDRHSFTGSVEISGSATIGTFIGATHAINGTVLISGSSNITDDFGVSGSLSVSGSSIFQLTGSNAVTVDSGYIILSEVSQSLNFADDTAAAAGGIPLGGLYRNGNFIQIRVS